MKLLICCLFFGAILAWNEHMENEGLLEGDIKLTTAQLLFGSVTYGRWTDNTVPYIIDKNLEDRKNVIEDAISVYHKRTCLKFVKRTTQRNYIHFFKGSGCWSHVGMTGGGQKLSLGPGCHWTATAQHEIGHAIGLHHEQTRPDRDQHVTIHLQNLNNQKMAYNFNKQGNIDSLGTPYDLYSMMHYGSTAFAKRGTKTITTNEKSKQYIIDNNYHYGMSDMDGKQINLMYKCKGPEGENEGGLKNKGKNCWGSCGAKGGSCVGYCGKDGVCCRQGWNDKGCETAETPCNGFHCCTAVKKPEVKNIGRDCWHHCNRKGGQCIGYCGKDGVCCRKGWNDKGCEKAASPCGYHCCTGIKLRNK